jgi:quinol-cytochrome oxidoreductase complex cytochrome b subunit
MIVAGLILLVISFLFPAPIERPITQAAVDIENARAPWFFLWVQQLLKLGDPFLWGVAVPVLLLLVLSLVPWLLPEAGDHEHGGWFPAGNRLAQLLLLAILLALLLLTLVAVLPASQL